MKYLIKQLNYLIYLLLLLYLTVDSITGISISANGPSFSIPYKLFILFLMIIVILNYDGTGLKSLFILFMSVLLSLAIVSLYINKISTFSFYLQQFIKLITNIIFLFYFLVIYDKEPRFMYFLKNILKINFLVFIFNMVIGIMGYGHSSYVLEDNAGSGTCGFFYAPNETFLILLSFVTIFLMNYEKKIIAYAIILFLSFKIGTKAAMLSIFVLVIFDYYWKSNKTIKKIILILIPLFCFFLYFIFLNFLSTLRTFEFVMHKLGNADGDKKLILNAIMSGRITYLEIALKNWDKFFNTLVFFFGTSNLFTATVEIDFFDSLFINGFVLTFIVLIFYFYLIVKAKNKKNYHIFVMNILFIFISFLAGHTWKNLSGGLFFVIANFMMIKDIKINFNKKNNISRYKRLIL